MSDDFIRDRIAEVLRSDFGTRFTEFEGDAEDIAEVLVQRLRLTEFSQPGQVTRCWITKRWVNHES